MLVGSRQCIITDPKLRADEFRTSALVLFPDVGFSASSARGDFTLDTSNNWPRSAPLAAPITRQPGDLHHPPVKDILVGLGNSFGTESRVDCIMEAYLHVLGNVKQYWMAFFYSSSQ